MNVCVPGQAERRVTSLISRGHLLSRSSLCAVDCVKGHFHYHLRMATPMHRQMFARLFCIRVYTYVHLQPLLYVHVMCLYRYGNRSCSALCSQSLPFFIPLPLPFVAYVSFTNRRLHKRTQRAAVLKATYIIKGPGYSIGGISTQLYSGVKTALVRTPSGLRRGL